MLGLGKCGVSVIRVSGPGVKKALAEIGGFKALPTPRKAELRKIREPETQEVIDHGLVFWFPSRCSQFCFICSWCLDRIRVCGCVLNRYVTSARKM